MANYFCTDSVEEQVDYLTDKVTDLNTKKLDKAAVVQATGTGIDVVMSQKAVTDTINENLQTINTEINGKLTKPTNPSAESAVTMLADGTVGTKPLSEIGGGSKLYRHYIRIGSENRSGYFSYISSRNTAYTGNFYDTFGDTHYNVISLDTTGETGAGIAIVNMWSAPVMRIAILNGDGSVQSIDYTYNDMIIEEDVVTEL